MARCSAEHMERRRVVVTGLGVISALGHNRDEFWQSLLQCRPGIAPIEGVDRTKLRFQNAAEVRGFKTAEHFDSRQALLLDRFAQFALVAAREAVAAAHVEWTPRLRERAVVITGSCVGGLATHEQAFIDLYVTHRD